MTTNSNNQDLYKKREEMYAVQNELARTTDENQRKKLLERQKKLDKELRKLVEKFDPGRQYCNDNKCSEMKSLTTQIHVKHLP